MNTEEEEETESDEYESFYDDYEEEEEEDRMSSLNFEEEEDYLINIDQEQNKNEYAFFDRAIIYIRSGSGGQGSSTYQTRGKTNQRGPPDGGDGGRGGDVIMELDGSMNTLAGLNYYSGGSKWKKKKKLGKWIRSFRAENGRDGEKRFRTGRGGCDTIIRVPLGTVIHEEIIIDDDDDYDANNDVQEQELINEKSNNKIRRLRPMGSISLQCPRIVVGKGGQGGEGSAAGQRGGVRSPRSPPEGGERKMLRLTLKVVADVALVGVPNAGKSTFLASVTRAKPKIANYPFTTVIPNLGVWIPSDYSYQDDTDDDYNIIDGSSPPSSTITRGGSSGLVLCDVPGLIKGAAEGAGLGHSFLQHVERCHVILHLVDATSPDPVGDFDMLNDEILRYGNGKLAQMPQIVVVNKIDVWEEEEEEMDGCHSSSREELELKLREAMTHTRLMFMSAKEKDGVDDLMERMAGFVRKVKDAKKDE